MKQPTSRQLYAYWNELRGERAAPARGEIDPAALRHALADIFMLEIDPVGQTRFRLAGTRCCALFDRELRGSLFADLWPHRARHDIERMLDAVLDDTVGIAAGLSAFTNDAEDVSLELLLLPLRYQGKTHARIIGALVPVPPAAWIGWNALETLETTSMRVIRPTGIDDAVPRGGEPLPSSRARFVVHQGGRA